MKFVNLPCCEMRTHSNKQLRQTPWKQTKVVKCRRLYCLPSLSFYLSLSICDRKVTVPIPAGRRVRCGVNSNKKKASVRRSSDRMQHSSNRVRHSSKWVRRSTDRVGRSSDRVWRSWDCVKSSSDRMRRSLERVRRGSERVRRSSERVRRSSERVRRSSDRAA
jgi:hypothetical protein